MYRSAAGTLTAASILAALQLAVAGLAPAQPPGRPPAPPQTAPGQPVRDATSKAGPTGVIRGRVLSKGAKEPLRRVHVALQSPALPQPRVTSTDIDGRFEFAELPPGRYRLSATKGSYVPIEYGQRRLGQPGRPVELAEGQTVEKTDLVMSKGAVISGQLFDDLGEPAALVRVSAMRRAFRNGRPEAVPAGHVVETDDMGQFRVFGLAPGSYYIAATGTVWAVDATTRVEAPALAPTYFPNAVSLAEAQRITVEAGEERGGANVFIRPVRAVRVSGTAFNSSSRPLDAVRLGSLDPVGGVAATGGSGIGVATPVGPDGTFVISNVAPGEYLLVAFARAANSGLSESAALRVTVGGADISGLALVTTGGVSVTGRIVVDGGGSPAISPKDAAIFAEPVGDGVWGSVASGGRIADDWSFELKGVAGPRLVRMRLPAGWTLKAVQLDGRDVTDSPLDVRGNDPVSDLRVVVTNRPNDVSGQVVDDEGRAVADYSVVVYSPDAAHWTATSRFLGTARPDQYGRYKLSGLPAGDYLAIAVDALDEGESMDPDFLEQMRGKAVPVTIGDGESKALNLRLVRR